MKGFCCAAVLLGILSATPVSAWERGDVDALAVLPGVTPGVPSSVEGLTVGPDDNIYATSFGFNATGAINGNSVLYVIKPNGNLVRKVPITNSSPHTLGLAFNPVSKFLLVLDFGAGNVLNVNPTTGVSTIFAVSPVPGSGFNALTFDKLGNVYISDSFNGVIWKTGPSGGTLTAWSSAPLLQPGNGVNGPNTGLTPPFGANGLQFNNAGNVLFVANTATHQIIQIPAKPDGSAGAASIFITGINAPDGIAIDRKDNLWVCANQEDDVVVIDKTGKVIAKLGDFNGINDDGIVRGLLFPASLAFSRDGKTLYVSNLSLYLPYAGAQEAVDSDWTLKVKHYTVSKMRAVIPPLGKHDEWADRQ